MGRMLEGEAANEGISTEEFVMMVLLLLLLWKKSTLKLSSSTNMESVLLEVDSPGSTVSSISLDSDCRGSLSGSSSRRQNLQHCFAINCCHFFLMDGLM